MKKGEVYYLVLDNVYEKGEGHSINFFFETKVNLKGVVKNDEGKPIITNVTITDVKGTTIAETTSDKKTGEYEIHTMLRRNVTYSINYFNDSSFVYSRTMTLKDTVELKNIATVLPKLKKGKKYSMGSINFYGSSSEYLPSAVPSIQNLYKLMSRNKKLVILIEGHVNCAQNGKQFSKITPSDELSTERAKKIGDYLAKKGIFGTRFQMEGKGCSQMLFPFAKDETEAEQNRRVEIKVLEF